MVCLIRNLCLTVSELFTNAVYSTTKAPAWMTWNWVPISWEQQMGRWVGQLSTSFLNINTTMSVRLTEFATNLISGNENILDGSANRDHEMLVVVDKGLDILNEFTLPGSMIVLDETLFDSIAQTLQRHEIVQATIKCDDMTYHCDLAMVTLADVQAAVVGRSLTRAMNHHWGRIITNRITTLLCAGFVCGILVDSVPISLLHVGFHFITQYLPARCDHHLEYEADRNSVLLAYKASFNPLGMMWLLEYHARRQSWARQFWQQLLTGFTYSTPMTCHRQATLLPLLQKICIAPDGHGPLRQRTTSS